MAWVTIYEDTDKRIARDSVTGEERTTYANPNRQALIDAAQAALVANRTFNAIASPTQAQTLAEVKRLAAQNNALIRFALQMFEGTD